MNAESEGYAIYHDLVIETSAERVFDAISNPSKLENWWPKRCTGTPELEAEYNFFFTPEYNWFGKVVAIESGKSFHVKMTEADTDWDPTSFGFDLVEVDGKTQVHFWHTGWPQCNSHYKRSSYCWAILLQGLKAYLENGIIIPFEDRE